MNILTVNLLFSTLIFWIEHVISPERWQRIQPILDGALDRSDDTVPGYLDSTCAGDAALRLDVERLLAAAKQGRQTLPFLETPIDRAAACILSESASQSHVPDPLAPGQVVGPYRVVRRIGAGGMGVVYLAHDSRLDRRVALKLLPPWLAADEAAMGRFTDEARAASALDHPNIATVYDIGDADGAGLHIAMAYYDGETLEERIRRGPLPAEDARATAIQLAEGLRAAHAKGIVHRDIKPANVIVTPEGVVKIVDFGVAKMGDRAQTAPDVTPGTVAYMSPEQTAGGRVDVRADIWAVGVVLYEMLAGRHPFRGDGRDAVVFAIRHDEPAPITTICPDAPQSLADAVIGCLAKDPGERFADADALLAALQGQPRTHQSSTVPAHPRRAATWAATAATIVLLAGAGVFFFLGGDQFAGERTPELEPVAHRIALLPLRDHGLDSANAYFASGMTDELITRLSKLRGLSVIAHASVMPYGGPDRSLGAIARTLDVRSVLEGSVSVTGDRVGIAVRLIDTASHERLWEEQYEVALVDIPGVHRDIAERVAAALDISLGAVERAELGRGGTTQPDAYRSYLRGRYWLGKSGASSYTKAREEFQGALDLDPTYALAWAGLSDALDHLAGSGMIASKEAYPRARAAAERALELDPELAEAHASLAMVLTSYYWSHELAERHFRRAIDLSPSYARAHRTYAAHLRNLCRLNEALAEAAVAERLDPLDYFSHWETWTALYFARRYEDTIAHARGLVELDVSEANVMIALAHTQRREYELALAALDEVDQQPNARAIRGHVYGIMGRRDDARRLLTAVDGAPEAGFRRAVIHLGLREPEEALAALEQAYQVRSWMLRLLKGEPIFDPLRANPQFGDLLKRIGLSEARSCSSPET
jgi:serine/threonine-protein kinase